MTSKTKKKLPQHLIVEPLMENIALLDAYTLSTHITDPVYQRIKYVLSYKPLAVKPCASYTVDLFKEYMDKCKNAGYSSNWLKSTVSHINKFFEYLKIEYSEIYTVQYLYGLSKLRLTQRPGKDENSAFQLSLVMINAIRAYIKCDPELEYVFELIYQTDIPFSQLKYCTPQNSNRETHQFLANGKIIHAYNDRIQRLIDASFETRDFDLSSQVIRTRLEKISKKLRKLDLYSGEKPIAYSDIQATRKAFFVKCPICGNTVENTSDNWVLAQFNDDPEKLYYLVCNACKGVQIT